MVFQLAILIVIPIIFGIVVVSPFDEPIEEPIEEEPIEVLQEEPDFNPLYILLGLIWLFFLIRILRQIMKGTYRVRTKI
jgi:hypothetical protein